MNVDRVVDFADFNLLANDFGRSRARAIDSLFAEVFESAAQAENIFATL